MSKIKVVQMYSQEEVIEAIRKAFWDGIDQGKVEYGGEYFDAEDYLPDPDSATEEE